MKRLGFDTYFPYIANEMVKYCMDYATLNNGYVYIYIVCEDGCTHTDAFFCIDGKVKKKHKLDLLGVDVSINRQKELVDNLTNLNIMLQILCEYNGDPMPKEIKVTYDISKMAFKRTLKYENQLDEVKEINEIFDEWFYEVRNEYGEI